MIILLIDHYRLCKVDIVEDAKTIFESRTFIQKNKSKNRFFRFIDLLKNRKKRLNRSQSECIFLRLTLMTTICSECQKEFGSEHNLKCHRYRELNKPPTQRCGEKRRRKLAKEQISESNLTDIVERANTASKTNELLEKLSRQNEEIIQQNNDLKEEVADIRHQNQEMKEMVSEFARNPKLLVLVDKLYPIQSLREIDLTTDTFKPVLEILEKELPEYPNLVNETTGKVHCKAVRKLNEIQPTAVKDEDMVFYKHGDVVTRGSAVQATTEFIDVFANSGYEYAQKASKDLKSTRDSDKSFQSDILKNAYCDMQTLEEL